MDVEIIKKLKPDQDWINIKGDYEQYHVYGDSDIYENYVEYTAALMQKLR